MSAVAVAVAAVAHRVLMSTLTFPLPRTDTYCLLHRRRAPSSRSLLSASDSSSCSCANGGEPARLVAQDGGTQLWHTAVARGDGQQHVVHNGRGAHLCGTFIGFTRRFSHVCLVGGIELDTFGVVFPVAFLFG